MDINHALNAGFFGDGEKFQTFEKSSDGSAEQVEQNVEWVEGMDSFSMYEDGWWRTTIRSLTLPNVPEIGGGSCGGMAALETLVIPKGVNKICCNAFAACTSLKNVTIPDTVTELGATSEHGTGGAFSGCSSLEQIEIPGSITVLYGITFGGCSSLRDITLNEGLLEIQGGAFNGCGSIEDITLPASIQSLTSGAFANMVGLKTVRFKGTPQSISDNAFPGATQAIDIYVSWAEGEVANAPWGATNATIHYNYTGE